MDFSGYGTAAHQVEGGNVASDLWLMENLPQSLFAEPRATPAITTISIRTIWRAQRSGIWRLSLFDRMGADRTGRGFYSRAALDHYRRMIAQCRALGIVPIVTFHHFTASVVHARRRLDDAQIR